MLSFLLVTNTALVQPRAVIQDTNKHSLRSKTPESLNSDRSGTLRTGFTVVAKLVRIPVPLPRLSHVEGPYHLNIAVAIQPNARLVGSWMSSLYFGSRSPWIQSYEEPQAPNIRRY